MNLDKLPLPRAQATDLALRAHSAMFEFRQGSAVAEHWEALAEVLNTVNALMCLNRQVPQVTPEMTKVLYLGLRSAECSDDELVEVDASLVPPLAMVVGAYDCCLQSLARRTMADAMKFIDRCIVEQASMDLDAWCASFEHPPMLTCHDLVRFDDRKVFDSGQDPDRSTSLRKA